MAERLSPREAKRLAWAVTAAFVRQRLDEDPPGEVLAAALDVGATDDTPALDDLDEDQAARALATAIDEVISSNQGRADRFLQAVTRKPKAPDVDELLCQLWELQVAEETVTRSKARPHNHGKHWFTWIHPDGHKETVEASTAVLAVGKAVRATEKRLRSNERRRKALLLWIAAA